MSFCLQDVTVTRGSTLALQGVSLQIEAGEAVALVGPSGGGKTTLLQCLTGAVQPSHGSVQSLGQHLAHSSPAALQALRCKLGYIPQDLGLVPAYRVLQNVMLGRAGQRGFWRSLRDVCYTARGDAEEVFSLLTEMGLPEKIYDYTSTLSGGQQQRVAIARALYQRPAALLADEPVSSLDPARARSVVELLLRSSRERGLTLVASLHRVELAELGFTRVIALRQGRVLLDAAPASLSAQQWADIYALPVS